MMCGGLHKHLLMVTIIMLVSLMPTVASLGYICLSINLMFLFNLKLMLNDYLVIIFFMYSQIRGVENIAISIPFP
jgi:hypothetical protein